MWEDYDLDNPSTWVPLAAPEVSSFFEQELTRIGGLNPFKKPNLVWRWGATYRDPMSIDNGLKYWLANREPKLRGFEFHDPVTDMDLFVEHLNEIPAHIIAPIPKYEKVELGQRRIIIEQWRSPEFLARSSRYSETTVRDPDDVSEFFMCRACDAMLIVGDNGPNPCAQCGSKRHYVRDFREQGERHLRSFPFEGCYDCFLILENSEGGPMAPDANALGWIEKLWTEQKTASLKDQVRNSLAEIADQTELMRSATSPANPFNAPATFGR